jgi:pyruvate/2-oxoglutarate/acetoin dehydrogenase E1 component
MRERLNRALDRVLSDDDQVVLLGEDILDPYGGAFKVTAGLSEKYPDRVLPMPISEAGFVGLAGGLALAGKRPIVEIMFGDFLGLAMDQLLNHLSNYHLMYNGQVRVPLVVRTPMGGRRGYGPTHSQSIEKHFLGMRGLSVVAPSPIHPLEPMLRSALAQPGPTLWIENKLAYNAKLRLTAEGLIDDYSVAYAGDRACPWAVLSLSEFASDELTLVGYGGMLPLMMDAARNLLLNEETFVRLLVPAQLSPLDCGPLEAWIVPGAPVVSVEEAVPAFGFGAEIGAFIASAKAGRVRSYRRLGALPTAIPASRTLEEAVLPQVQDIEVAIRAALAEP